MNSSASAVCASKSGCAVKVLTTASTPPARSTFCERSYVSAKRASVGVIAADTDESFRFASIALTSVRMAPALISSSAASSLAARRDTARDADSTVFLVEFSNTLSSAGMPPALRGEEVGTDGGERA